MGELIFNKALGKENGTLDFPDKSIILVVQLSHNMRGVIYFLLNDLL